MQEQIKLKWANKTTEMTAELIHVPFYNIKQFLDDAGTILSNYFGLSICQVFVFHENLL